MLVDELAAWARADLLAAYRVLCLVLHWSEHTAIECVRDQSSTLQAVAMRWDPAARYPGPVRLHYAARSREALEEASALMPPEGGCAVIAPNTEAHQWLLALRPATRQPDEFLYTFAGVQPPDVSETAVQVSASDAPSVGLQEPWDWPSILGDPATERPIHCVIKDGRAVAVAAAGHPTMKPLPLIERTVQNATELGHLVGDPFLGSGTAIIAAERTGRRCYGFDLDARYCDVILARWEQFAGADTVRVDG